MSPAPYSMVWPVAFVMFAALEYYLSAHQRGHSGRSDWLYVALAALGPTGLVVMVVVTRNGVPEVIATVRSTEEYLELAGSGQLPHDHRVYLPDDA